MARTTTKKKTTKKATTKKASTKKKTTKKAPPKAEEPDEVDDLLSDVEADLDNEFDFAEGDDESGEDSAPKKLLALVGKTMRFSNEEGDEIEGVVTQVEKSEDDGKWKLIVEDDEAEWEADPQDCEEVNAEEPEDAEEEEPEDAEEEESSEDAEEVEEEPEDAEEEESSEDAEEVEEEPEDADEEEPSEDAEEEPESTPGDYTVHLLPIDSIKVPKLKAREVNPESEKYKRMASDIKRRGLRTPIEVDSLDKPVLTAGAHRLAIRKEQGATEIPVLVFAVTEGTQEGRLFDALMENEMRQTMHWTELAKSFALLVKGGFSQRKIARSFGINEGEVSRLINTLKLPKALRDVADAQRELAKSGEGEQYAKGVFTELTQKDLDPEVLSTVKRAFKDGATVTVGDVRELKKQAKKRKKKEAEESAEGEEGEEAPTSSKPERNTPPSGGQTTLTKSTLSSEDTGDYVQVIVREGSVEVRFHVDWPNKTFRGFNPVQEFKDTLDAVYASDDTALGSLKALQKALTAARSELGSK